MRPHPWTAAETSHVFFFQNNASAFGAHPAVLMLFCGVNFWNSYFNGLIYLSERSAYPQMFLREILLNNMADSMTDTAVWTSVSLWWREHQHAVIIVSSVPMLVLYPFLQFSSRAS